MFRRIVVIRFIGCVVAGRVGVVFLWALDDVAAEQEEPHTAERSVDEGERHERGHHEPHRMIGHTLVDGESAAAAAGASRSRARMRCSVRGAGAPDAHAMLFHCSQVGSLVVVVPAGRT